MSSQSSFTLHPPHPYPPQTYENPFAESGPRLQPLRLPQILGTWYITHTTSPVWRDKRNVTLRYTNNTSSSPSIKPSKPHQGSNNAACSTSKLPVLDDIITYQSLVSDKIERMVGTDTPSPLPPTTLSSTALAEFGAEVAAEERSRADAVTWTWRGTGWLKFVTSRWEILGYSGEMVSAMEDQSEGIAISTGNGAVHDGERRKWIVVHAQKSRFTPEVINIYARDKRGLDAGLLKKVKEGLMGLGVREVESLVEGLYETRQE